ncbi:MAG: hypothetical protein DIZ78_16505 [endosymbiont of Escarpia spicata]|uniref:Uncharacterized protein n=1 Tax=endosymbiont of Escarpia spicata TaxID=2200908 RepID=A0A370DAX0_9GAMM|nr:MAG: hypothetical protein DIZ78_16505 [endosymbiont of Escarpia spicata]
MANNPNVGCGEVRTAPCQAVDLTRKPWMNPQPSGAIIGVVVNSGQRCGSYLTTPYGLYRQMGESEKLDAVIRKNMEQR